jgi:hypothetical protein
MSYDVVSDCFEKTRLGYLDCIASRQSSAAPARRPDRLVIRMT